MHEEDVAVEAIRNAEQGHVTLTQRFQVVAKAPHIHPGFAADRDRVRNPPHFELTNGKIAGLHGVVDQLRVVVGFERPETVRRTVLAPHRRREPPFRRARIVRLHDLKLTGHTLLPLHREEHARTVEIRMRVVEMGAAYAQVVRIDLGDQR